MSTSELPLMRGDDQPPIVIDLPEGQKLVVGSIANGTVIEIATWRGTGRPDSRTNRIMIGMSQSETKATIIDNGPKSIENQVASPTQADDESIEESNKAVSNKKIASVVTKDPTKRGSKKGSWRGFTGGETLRRTLIGWSLVAGLILVAIIPGNVRVAHAKSGYGSALSSVSSSLIFVRKSPMVAIGDRVVATVAQPKSNPAFGVVTAVGSGSVLLATPEGTKTISDDDIHGTLIFVMPYVGYFAKFIGR